MPNIDILVEGDVSTAEIANAEDICKQPLHCEGLRLVQLDAGLALDAVVIAASTNIITCLAAVASLLYSLVTHKSARTGWTAEALKTFIATELMKINVTSYEVKSIDNFQGLIQQD